MGQIHVNKLFKLLLNSQGVPFKISMYCQIWCLIIQSSGKVQRTELRVFGKWGDGRSPGGTHCLQCLGDPLTAQRTSLRLSPQGLPSTPGLSLGVRADCPLHSIARGGRVKEEGSVVLSCQYFSHTYEMLVSRMWVVLYLKVFLLGNWVVFLKSSNQTCLLSSSVFTLLVGRWDQMLKHVSVTTSNMQLVDDNVASHFICTQNANYYEKMPQTSDWRNLVNYFTYGLCKNLLGFVP